MAMAISERLTWGPNHAKRTCEWAVLVGQEVGNESSEERSSIQDRKLRAPESEVR